MRQKIAWITGYSGYIEPLEERLREERFTVERFECLIPALRAFDITRYDAILLDPMLLLD